MTDGGAIPPDVDAASSRLDHARQPLRPGGPRHLRASPAQQVRWFNRLGDLCVHVFLIALCGLFLATAGAGVFEAGVRWPVVTAIITGLMATVGVAAWRSMAVRNLLRPVTSLWWLPFLGAIGLGVALNDFMGEHVWRHLPNYPGM